MKIPSLPRIEKHTHDSCRDCCMAIEPDENGYFDAYNTGDRRGAIISLHQICRECFVLNEAFKEADAEGRRYTKISPFKNGQRWYCYAGEACPCGNVSLYILDGWCITCSREVRMLEKKMAEARFNRRLLKTLKEEVKNVCNQNNG